MVKINWKPLYDFLNGKINFEETCKRLIQEIEDVVKRKVENHD